MFSYCKNYAVFKHPDSDYLSELVEELNLIPSKDGRKSELFNFIEPNPYKDEISEEADDWKLEHWGTQSDAEVTDFYYDEEKDPFTIIVTFYTEWSPPIDLYQYMISDGWEVEAMFHEPEYRFVGSFKNEQEIYYDYDFSEGDNFLENIPEELIKFGELRNLYKKYLKEKKVFFDEDNQDDA